ncbi:MAG: type II toxin-antitoxin system RelE/ParE family toxin [Legionella sp.]
MFIISIIFSHQQFLLAYEWDPALRILLALGVHENFYRDLEFMRNQ